MQKALVPDHSGSTSQWLLSVPRCNRECPFQDSAKSIGPTPFREHFPVLPFRSAMQPEVPFPGLCKKHWSQTILGVLPSHSFRFRGTTGSALSRIVRKALVPDHSGSISRSLLSAPRSSQKCLSQDNGKSIGPRPFWEHFPVPPVGSAVQPKVPFPGSSKNISPTPFREHFGVPPPNSAVQPEVPFAG